MSGRSRLPAALLGVAAVVAGGVLWATRTPPGPPPVVDPGPPKVAWTVPHRHAKSPVAVGPDKNLITARTALWLIVEKHGLVTENPWAVKHALLAAPPGVRLADGRDAVDALFADYAIEVPIGGRSFVDFPARRERPGLTDIRIEPHTDLQIKGFAEAGVAPERVVSVAGHPHPLGDLLDLSLYRMWVDGDRTSRPWDDLPWTLQAVATYAPAELAWVGEGGHPTTLDAVTHAMVEQLGRETTWMRADMLAGRAYDKIAHKKAGDPQILGYTCGGAHLLQGAMYAVARGHGDPGDPAKIRDQMALLYYRYDVEMAVVDRAIREVPEQRLRLFSQRLKFLAHFLETAHKAAAMGIYLPDEGQRLKLTKAAAELVATTKVLYDSGVADGLSQIQAEDEQLYLDYVGDAAHGVKGLDLAIGTGEVWY